jgi:hypothetical protein
MQHLADMFRRKCKDKGVNTGMLLISIDSSSSLGVEEEVE